MVNTQDRGLRDIPLDAIVGSVGRYTDFTHSFMPLRDSDRHRWASVEVGMTGMAGLPPTEVYQIGDVYFVKDGNHRVSVARQLEIKSIEAYVSEVQTKIPLTPDVKPDDLIMAAEYVEFLERTRLDELRPDADLRVTLPGRYQEILEHIDLHHYLLSDGEPELMPYEKAVLYWFDEIYTPITDRIERQGMLRDFPGRTPLDLYMWISRHQSDLKDTLGWDVSTEFVADDVSKQFSTRPARVLSRVGEKLADVLTPDPLEGGPRTGQWRRAHERDSSRKRLFENILVPVTGREEHWFAVHQALQVARREGGRILGLHVIAQESDATTDAVREIRSEFFRRCTKAGAPMQFSTDVGQVARVICDRARWSDLTVIRLMYPPDRSPIARLGSGIRLMLHRCAGPLLLVPRSWYSLEHPLLAYNGTDKAKEALFVTAYLAERWRLQATVLAAAGAGNTVVDNFEDALNYLQSQNIDANYIQTEDDIRDAILKVAQERENDLIILGGYSAAPVAEIVRDSNVNELLRSSRLPMLICR